MRVSKPRTKTKEEAPKTKNLKRFIVELIRPGKPSSLHPVEPGSSHMKAIEELPLFDEFKEGDELRITHFSNGITLATIKTFLFIIASALLTVALNAQDVHAITRAEILEGYKAELKPDYNDPSLNPAATALCQLIARRLHPTLPDTSQLDYDLDEKQNQYFEKIAIQLDLDKKTRGLVAWRIFRDACKAEVGYYQEPSRWNGWKGNWIIQETEQEKAEWLQYNHYAKRLKDLCDKEIKIWEKAGSPGGSYACKNWPLGFDAWLNQLKR
ncbi:MAG: hypothetical protein OXB94_09715 [Nitrospira sp.]|nr:hypothetical protein [Nitrospira sp.]